MHGGSRAQRARAHLEAGALPPPGLHHVPLVPYVDLPPEVRRAVVPLAAGHAAGGVPLRGPQEPQCRGSPNSARRAYARVKIA
jgi:hypothetical protein